VAHYRAYFLDESGHIVKARDLVLKDDAEAISVAKQLINGHDVEVWERDRKVASLKRPE
jgi:hypothetical protein